MSTFNLDLTGLHLSNKITNESQLTLELNSRGFYFIVPQFTPFFEDNLIVKRTVSGVTTTLTKDTDYFLGGIAIGVSTATTKKIYSVIVINPTVRTGSFSITYQTLGGEYETDSNTFITSLSTLDINPLNTSWEQISHFPHRYPDTPTPWYHQDATNQEDLINKLHDLENSIITTASTNLQNNTITFEGAVVGSGNVSIPIELAETGVVPGTYVKLTINEKGLVTAGQNVGSLAELGITEDYATTTRMQELIDAAAVPISHVGAGGESVHAVATATEAGFMSAADKALLDTKHFYPASNQTPRSIGTAAAGTVGEMARADHVHPMTIATATTPGFMSAADLQKIDGIEAGAQANVVTSVFGRTGAVVVTKADLGLGNVDNTLDANKPISTPQQTALDNEQNKIFDIYNTQAYILALNPATNSGKIAKASDTRKEYVSSGTAWVEKTSYAPPGVSLARTPEAISPKDNAFRQPTGVVLVGYDFSPLYEVDTFISREFELTLATDTNYSSVVFNGTVNTTSISVGVSLTADTDYIWRCRDNYNAVDNDDNAAVLTTNWSSDATFSVKSVFINDFTVLSITDGPVNVPSQPTVVTSGYAVTGSAETHVSTTWKVYDSTDTLIYTNANDTVNKTSWVIPSGILDAASDYRLTVQYNSTTLQSNEASFSFSTDLVLYYDNYVASFAYTPNVNKLALLGKDGDNFIRIDNDGTYNDGNSVPSFSSDGNYLGIATTSGTSNFISFYKRSGNNYYKLPNPSSMPTAVCRCIHFSPNTQYVAVCGGSAPGVNIYKRSGDTFTKLTPTSIPVSTNSAKWCCFSPDNTYLVFVGDMGLYIYKRSGDTFTILTTIADPINGSVYSACFSPDGNYLVMTGGSERIGVYKRSGDTFTKLTSPVSGLPGVGAVVVSSHFSPDGNYLAVGVEQQYNNAMIYKRSGDSFTYLRNFYLNDCYSAVSVRFSPDGNYFSFSAQGSGSQGGVVSYIIMKKNGDTFTPLPANSQPAGYTNTLGGLISTDLTWYQKGYGATP